MPRSPSGATVFPTSPAQRRLYFLHQLAPGSPAYNVPLLLTVRGELDFGRLERALRALQLRHEVLRTTFETRDGDIVQLVHASDSAPPVLLRRGVAEGVELEARRAWAVDEAVRRAEAPFDLQVGPLWHVDALEVSPTEHVVLLCFQHIIIDELSVPVLAAELEQLYENERAFEGVPLGPQYADFCVWQQQSSDPSRLEYWKKHLADLEPQRLPEDGVRQGKDPFAGDQVLFTLAPPLDSLLEGASRRLGASPFMVLISALAVVLHRWTGQSDIAIGTITTQRPDPEFTHTPGFFSNALALRCAVTPDTSFRALLTSVRKSVLGAIEHHDVPFESVVEAVRPRRDGGRNPLFQASIAYNRQRPESLWRLPGLEVEPLAFSWSSSQFGLTLGITRETGGVLVGNLWYSTAQLSRPMAEQLVESFTLVLRHFLERPDSLASEAPLLSEATRQRVLELGSGGVDTWTGPSSVWELFSALADAQAGTEALRAVDGSLSFAELRAQAEAWGAVLAAHGVGPEVVVGIHLPRRAALVTAMLATWHAGGAFLLLDPAAPPERLRMLARDAEVSLVLVGDEASGPFAGGDIPVLPLSQLAKAEPARGAPAPRATDNALAYVMFTSGSTGRPKGTMIEQRSVVAHVLTQLVPSYADAPSDRPWRVAALCAVTFDVFVNQFLSMAGLGHTLVLLSEEERLDPVGLLRRNSQPDTALDVLECSTSQLEVLVEAGLLETPYPPSLLRFGGESVSPRLWEQLQRAPRTRAFNVYGLTECTVCSTRVDVRAHPAPVAGRAVGIGKLYIVDERGQLLPPGFMGEVCIGGEGVGRGYRGHPELTRERFVPDPFSTVPGARMYRTGDGGRLRHDGQLEFRGRLDDQLKVRGYRIEPGEVETALRAHTAIAQAAIVATTPSGEGALVAFVIPAAGAKPEELATAHVREFLKRRLPAALLPDRVESLETLPLTRNGKVDRAALRELAARLSTTAPSEGEARAPEERPATPTETTLRQLFAELLGRPQVRLEDDFFELGGHSLLAIRAVFRIARELGHPLTLGTFVAHPTPASLAAHLATLTRHRPTGLALLRRGEGPETFVLFHPVGGMLTCYEPLVRALPAGPTVLGCERVHGAQQREESLEALAERYAEQVRLAAPTGPLVLSGWSLGGVLAYAVAGRLLHHGREVHRLELIDAQAVRRPADREELRALGHRWRELAAEVRSTRSTQVLVNAPDAASLLGSVGVRPPDFLQLEPDTATTLMEDWAHLLALGAEVALSPLPVPTRLLACEDNPSHTLHAIRQSWEGLCASLTVEAVSGDHASVLLAPAVTSVARALARAPRDPAQQLPAGLAEVASSRVPPRLPGHAVNAALDHWYQKAMVRTGMRPVLVPEAIEGTLFPERQIPHLRHPLVQQLPPSGRQELVARYLYQYLLYTTHLEVEVVNRAIEHILRGLPGVDISQELRLEALSIYCDEGYHSLASLDVVQQIVKSTGIAPPPYDFAPTLRRLDGAGHQLLPEDPVLAQILQVVVFETVVTSILNEVPKDPSVCAVVRQVVQEHARDEGRHHAFFSAFFTQLWSVLPVEQRERVARCLPRLAHACLRWDTTPIAWSLDVAGLSPEEIAQVLDDCYGDQAAIPAVRNATRHLVRLCESLGVLDVPGGREAFTELGLV